MTALPKFTIVTPSHNQGRFIENTILSVLNQGYPNVEYFVIDGGSSDGTCSILERYDKHIDYWTSEPDRGQSHAINKGFARATGDLLTWLNSDDRLEPDALRIVAEHAARFPDAGAFVGHGQIVDAAGRVVYRKAPADLSFPGLCRWNWGGDFTQPSCFFRRSAWEIAGPLDEDVHIALDVDLWLRMVTKVPFQPIDALLSTALMHPEAKTVRSRDEMVVETIMVVARAGGGQFIRRELTEMVKMARVYEAGRLKHHALVRPLLRFSTALWRRTLGRPGRGPRP
jgi:glycosyltransferase involved in cell wall biosynthesis